MYNRVYTPSVIFLSFRALKIMIFDTLQKLQFRLFLFSVIFGTKLQKSPPHNVKFQFHQAKPRMLSKIAAVMDS